MSAGNRPNPGELCPDCGGPVEWNFSCHTYEQDGRWMACVGCDSAQWWYCVAGEDGDGCGWNFTDGLNPRNPRWSVNEPHRPDWLAKEGAG